MEKRILRIALFFCLTAVFPLLGKAQFYNGSMQEFGKNRLQYKNFLWQYYDFDKFQTYYYEGGKNLAIYTAKTAKTHLAELEELFDYKLDDKIEFVVYTKLQDFRQSNVALSVDEGYNIGGVTRIQGSKIFLYYEGNHSALDKQIRSGLSNVLLNKMIYGGNWKEVIKNSTLLSLPQWYLDGLISYASNPWDTELDGYVRDGILSDRFNKFNRLEGEDARIAGHSMWNYIAEVYGENVIPNILYMTRISRNLESGFLFVIGVSLKTLSYEYLDYYRKRYEADEKIRGTAVGQQIPIKVKKNRSYSQFYLSPDTRYATFVTNQMGQYKVYLYDISEDKYKKIMKREHKLNRIIDESFPIMAWHPRGGGFAFVTEQKGKVWMHIYTMETGKVTTRELFNLDKVLSMRYDKTGKNMVFSAVKGGQTDIFVYNVIGNRQTQITNDPFDDMWPAYADDGRSLIFSSNRTDDTLRSDVPIDAMPGTYDIFLYPLERKNRILTRITETPFINETQPAQYDSINYTYLSNENGVVNRYIARYDSVISHIDTAFHYRYFTRSFPLSNLDRNILEYSMNSERGKYSMLLFKDGKYEFWKGYRDQDTIMGDALQPTEFMGNYTALMENQASTATADSGEVNSVTTIKVFGDDPKKKDKVDIENYEFGGGNNEEKPKKNGGWLQGGGRDNDPTAPKTNVATTVPDTADVEKEPEFVLPKASVYRLNFATDYVVTQVDNSFLNASYQRFSGGGTEYYNPGFNGLLKLGISDLFEDHRLVGATRLTLDFNSSEYYLAYHDLSKRWDKTYLFHRQTLLSVSDFRVVKVITNEAKYLVKYPFNEVSSIRGTVNIRRDDEITMSTDINTIDDENVPHNLAALKVEYIFDNTIPKGLNLYNGTRMKIWGEWYQEVDKENTDFKVIGLDARHYQKVHRDMIVALRFAASTSFGSQRLVHYMGGVDNWLFAKFDNTIPIANDQGYAFQTIATPVRGFWQNARNGNSFALANAELRWPIFKYFLDRPIRSDFIENFQFVGFSDVGTAFTGSNPYSEDNTFNISTIHQAPLTITIQNQREPIIWGYGFGLRSRIWGYFVRADWAWGVDDGVILDNVFYLSLSLDF